MQGGIVSMCFQRVSICLSLLLFSGLLFTYANAGTASKLERFISLEQPEISAGQQDQKIIWKMTPTDNGITSTIILNLAKPKKVPGISGKLSGECRVEIDGMVVKRDSFTEPDATIKQALPFSTVVDGDHVISLTIRDFDGKLHTQNRKFRLDASPGISVTNQDKDKEIFDPVFIFSFFGEQEANAGIVDTYLDERPLKPFSVTVKQNHKPIKLSEFIGNGIYKADLTPGTHLLTIIAHGSNGSSTTQTFPITVKAQEPVISVQHTNDKTVETIEITFPAASNKIVGSAEVHLNHSIILQVLADKTKISIPRADLHAALKKHQQKSGKEPVSMIISARSANQVETWQDILFQ
jgi:hypothetical protein